MLETIRMIIICGTLLVGGFMVLVAMPQSKMREILMPIVGWAVAALSAVYVVSPLDIVPDFIPIAGWLDDGGAIVTGIAGAVMAMKAQKEHQQRQSG